MTQPGSIIALVGGCTTFVSVWRSLETVSDAIDGLDDLGMLWIVFDSFSKLTDCLVEGATVRDMVFVPADSKQLFTRDDFALVLSQ